MSFLQRQAQHTAMKTAALRRSSAPSKQRGFLALTELIGFAVGGTRPLSYAYVASAADTGNRTIYAEPAFQGLSLGAASYDRVMLLSVFGGGDTSDTTIAASSIAGVSGTVLEEVSHDLIHVAIIGAIVRAGTSGDVSVEFSGGKSRCLIDLYAIYGLDSLAVLDSDSHVNANPLTKTLTTRNGGLAFGIAANNATTQFTWTNLTEDDDDQVEGADTTSVASGTTSGNSTAFTAEGDAGGTDRAAVFVSF